MRVYQWSPKVPVTKRTRFLIVLEERQQNEFEVETNPEDVTFESRHYGFVECVVAVVV